VPDTKKTRLAIVGAGGIARGAHLRGLHALKAAGRDLCEVVAVCDTVAENANLAAERTKQLGLGDPRVYTSWEQMLRDGVADAVDICLPHGLHHVAGIAALEAGLHVFCEKPYTVSIKTGRALAEAADRAGKVLATGVCHRRMPGQRAVHWAINQAKLIGDPRLFFASYTQYRPPAAPTQLSAAARWRRDRVMGGGAGVIDSGFHFLDTIRYFFGEVERVYAELRSPTAGRDGILADRENTAVVTFSFKSGVVGTWSWSFAVPGHETRNIVLYGSEGSIEDTGYSDRFVIYHLFMGPGELRRHDGKYLSMSEMQRDMRQALGAEQVERLFPGGVTDHFGIELWDFLDAVQSGRKPEVDGWDGLRTLALVESIYESALTGQAIGTEDVLSGKVGQGWQGEIDAHWEEAARLLPAR
jgi:UDP-N-acetyl-2-amino-2-deoxyglucuronate dehydrogenase